VSPRRLAATLRDYRRANTLTQSRLAKRAGVSQGYIAALERGIKRHPSVSTLKRLARALGVRLTQLMQ
jgi:transcriptional regulator with XRE-family HTH domain